PAALLRALQMGIGERGELGKRSPNAPLSAHVALAPEPFRFRYKRHEKVTEHQSGRLRTRAGAKSPQLYRKRSRSATTDYSRIRQATEL
ncbi:hypothetical protein U8L64_00210, partial [Pseudomonas sp. FIP_A4]